MKGRINDNKKTLNGQTELLCFCLQKEKYSIGFERLVGITLPPCTRQRVKVDKPVSTPFIQV